jgi:hypothetical protein
VAWGEEQLLAAVERDWESVDLDCNWAGGVGIVVEELLFNGKT